MKIYFGGFFFFRLAINMKNIRNHIVIIIDRDKFAGICTTRVVYIYFIYYSWFRRAHVRVLANLLINLMFN